MKKTAAGAVLLVAIGLLSFGLAGAIRMVTTPTVELTSLNEPVSVHPTQ